MDIRLEDIDAVRARTGVSYEEAREALQACDGSVVDALVYLEQQKSAKKDDLLGKIKAVIKEGNVSKIRFKRNGKVLLTVPVTVGIVGGVVGATAMPWWGLLAAAAATYGFDVKCEVLRDDGSVTVIW